MIKLGLIGFPIEHSLSPDLYHGFMEVSEINGSYRLFPMRSITLEELKHLFTTHELTGCNVTIPLKEAVLPLLDRIDPTAKAIGAVNTIVLESGKLVGYNTDCTGIEKALDELNSESTSALIFGTGGAAKAVKYVLNQRGISAKMLTRQLGPNNYNALTAEDFKTYKLWINCTPLGGPDYTDVHLPIPYGVISPEFAIFDLIYNPLPTPLLQAANDAEARSVDGRIMLTEQANKAWKLFRAAYYKNL
ncbi:shikimate dehydrogenase [Schleiferiaceae bacterium]|nr:shikimate dehydrogenase [Schleiferiaceae bacterium]